MRNKSVLKISACCCMSCSRTDVLVKLMMKLKSRIENGYFQKEVDNSELMLAKGKHVFGKNMRACSEFMMRAPTLRLSRPTVREGTLALSIDCC